MTKNLTTAQLDRACGVLLGTAAGDALGAGYEFGPPLDADVRVLMKGGGGFRWAPGEWTDDTSMAIAIAEVAATGADLRDESAQDAVVQRWYEWSRTASDVGNQTRSVLGATGRDSRGVGAAAARDVARELHERTGHTAGNGSLMRTSPVALAYLDDEGGLVAAAASISALTHHDPEAGEACVLWCLAIRHAVLAGELDVRVGLDRLTPDRRDVWAARIDTAEKSSPADFVNNGWVVEALQGAWSAIAGTTVPVDDPADGRYRVDHLRLALESAVRGGRDADTVAAIGGGLLGAAYGASAVPATWRRKLHGWPGLRARDLVELATAITRRGHPDSFDLGYSGYGGVDALVQHPYDDKVWLGGAAAIRDLPEGVDAVVSLCRVGPSPDGVDVVEFRLIDRPEPGENPNLGFVLNDAAAVVVAFRAEGRSVLVHCVQAHSRTPAVGAMYAVRAFGADPDEALARVSSAVLNANPIGPFRAAIQAAARTRK